MHLQRKNTTVLIMPRDFVSRVTQYDMGISIFHSLFCQHNLNKSVCDSGNPPKPKAYNDRKTIK